MALDLTADEALSVADLVTGEEDLQPYVLEWPSVPDADGLSEAIVVVVLKRRGGFLLGVPPGFVPEAVLARANQGQEAGPIGASSSVVVPGILVDGGVRAFTGSQMEVVLVDVSADLVSQLRASDGQEDIAVPFDPENPFALPSPADVVSLARDWIRGAGDETGLTFYSADGHLEDQENLPQSPMQAQRPFTPSSRRPRGTPKPNVTPSGSGKPAEKPKRVTTASLAASLDQLLDVVPALSSQIQDLAEKHQVLENRMVAPSRAGALGLSQPLSAAFPQASSSLSTFARNIAPPPRTKESVGFQGMRALDFQPKELAALEEEKTLDE